MAEVFTGFSGRFVELKDTIAGFKDLIEGKYDELPEKSFYMVGGVDEAAENAAKMAAELEAA